MMLLLLAMLVACSNQAPIQSTIQPSTTIDQSLALNAEEIYQELQQCVRQEQTIEQTAQTISLGIESVYVKVLPKVKQYVLQGNHSEKATTSYARYIASMVNDLISQTKTVQ